MAKVDLYPDFREFLKSLNSAGVEYLVLGGYAVIYYGYRRTTDDLDVWIAATPDNASKVSRILRKWGGFASSVVRPTMFIEPRKVFMFGREPVRIDILTGPDGVDFADCYPRRHIAILDGVQVPLLSLDDLRKNKRASGRNKDKADLEHLPSKFKPRPERTPKRRKRK